MRFTHLFSINKLGWGLGLLALILTSCGVSGDRFRIEGRLLNMNQGEFYIYGGNINGFDTIKVRGGRFAYEKDCNHEETLTMVFPNFSQVPIFAEPGISVEIDGDASHLKEMKITGSKTNKLMSQLREQLAQASPDEAKKYVAQFVNDHPESPVCEWVVKNYFITSPLPDYAKARQLLAVMQKAQPDNGRLALLARRMKWTSACSVGSRLPKFKATDINGKTVSSASLSSGIAVICTWASWNYNSTSVINGIKRLGIGDKIKVLTINVDASKVDARNNMKMNQMEYPTVFSGGMFQDPLLKQLGLLSVPGNIVVNNGKIVARDLSSQKLQDKLKSLI